MDFAYPTRPDVPVFRSFSLVAPAGRVTALVGESGSGKSTIVNLVERFYDVDNGAVLLDGTNIKALDVTWLRAQVRSAPTPLPICFFHFALSRVSCQLKWMQDVDEPVC